MKTTDADYGQRIQRLRNEHSMADFLHSRSDLARTVRMIVSDVAERGDAAVAEFTEKFDKVTLSPSEFRVSNEALKAAHEQLPADLLNSLRKSIANVRHYQSEIFIGNKQPSPGIRYTPLNRCGVMYSRCLRSVAEHGDHDRRAGAGSRREGTGGAQPAAV